MTDLSKKLSLNTAVDADGVYWLVLACPDTTQIYPLAQFLGRAHEDTFTQFMETQGYEISDLPSSKDLEQLFE